MAGKGLADGQLPTVAGATGVPRGCAWLCWNEDSEGILVMVAPPPDGRRSLAGDGIERQSSRVSRRGGATAPNRAKRAHQEVEELTRRT